MEDLGVRVGYVYKKDNNGWQQFNVARPFEAFNVPVTRPDPGPDNVVGNGDDGPALNLFNLDDTTRGSNQVTTNIPGYEGTYKTLEFSANKRYSSRWSMVASYSYTWTTEYGRSYFGQTTATAVSNFSFGGSYPTNPNEHTLNDFTNWNVKFSGSADAGWGIRLTPVLKVQGGAPYGRVICGQPELQHRAAHPRRAARHPAAGHGHGVRHPHREAAAVREQGPPRAVPRPLQPDEFEHRDQHQLARGHGVREGHDRPAAADREVRREVQLVTSRRPAERPVSKK